MGLLSTQVSDFPDLTLWTKSLTGHSARTWAHRVTPGSDELGRWAPSAVGPPAQRQRTLLGFLKMSSLTRHSLEQIEVAAGTLAPEQTRNHQVWRGPLALYSASPDGTK